MAATAAAVAVKKHLRPRNKWVLIRKIVRQESRTADGVVIPGEKEELSSFGVVVASAVEDLKPGDEVIFTAFPISIQSIEEITGDRSLFLVREEEVFSVVENYEEEPSCT